MLNLREEYRKNRASMNALQEWKCAQRAVKREFEQKLSGFSAESSDDINYVVLYEGDEYSASAWYDTDYHSDLFDGGGVEILDKRPYSGQYAREQVMQVDSGRYTRWLVLDESPQSRAKWYSKQGHSRGVAYELGAASCVRILSYYRKMYAEGDDAYYVEVMRDGKVIESCGGIPHDEVEDFIWSSMP